MNYNASIYCTVRDAKSTGREGSLPDWQEYERRKVVVREEIGINEDSFADCAKLRVFIEFPY
jgi:hypothetical protein